MGAATAIRKTQSPPPRRASPPAQAAPNTQNLSARYQTASRKAVEQFATQAAATVKRLETGANGKKKGIKGSDLDHRLNELNRTLNRSAGGGGNKNRAYDLVDLSATVNNLRQNLDPRSKKFIKDPAKRATLERTIQAFDEQFVRPSGGALTEATRAVEAYRHQRKKTGWQGGFGNAVANVVHASDGSNATVKKLHENSDAVRTFAYLAKKADRTPDEQRDYLQLGVQLGTLNAATSQQVDRFEAQVEKNGQRVNQVAVGTAVVVVSAATGGTASPLLLGGAAALTSVAANATDNATGARHGIADIAKQGVVTGVAVTATAGVLGGSSPAVGTAAGQSALRAAGGNVVRAAVADRVGQASSGATSAALDGRNPIQGAVRATTQLPGRSDLLILAASDVASRGVRPRARSTSRGGPYGSGEAAELPPLSRAAVEAAQAGEVAYANQRVGPNRVAPRDSHWQTLSTRQQAAKLIDAAKSYRPRVGAPSASEWWITQPREARARLLGTDVPSIAELNPTSLDLAATIAGTKPAAITSDKSLSNPVIGRLIKSARERGLTVTPLNGQVFVGKAENVAALVRQFEEIAQTGFNADAHRVIGANLGYPKSAVDAFVGEAA